MDAVLALDLGGTKFAAALVDSRGEVHAREQVLVDHDVDGEGVWRQLVGLISDVLGHPEAPDYTVLACGVGSAGPISPNLELVSPLNLAAWRDFPLRERLSDELEMLVVGDLDTKALAVGEGWKGAAQGRANYVAMVVSTGIGGGIVLNGRLLDGTSGNAGHIGHIIVAPDGHPCTCGAHGCLEAEASGTAIANITGSPATEANYAVIERTGRMVGRGVASVMNLLELDLAVVGGSVALGFGQPFFDAAQAELDTLCRFPGDVLQPAIVPAGLGDAAPLVGAAAVAWNTLGRLG